MTSYERVKAALEFTIPDRLPVHFDSLGHSDFHWVVWNQHVDFSGGVKYAEDIWGCGWSRTEMKNMGQITNHPIDEWDKLDDYVWPDPDNPAFYKGMEERFNDSEDKFITTDIFMLLFERMQGLRGMANVLMDFYVEPEKIAVLADRIMEFQIRIMQNINKRFPEKIHCLSFTEDWGTETALIISPELWREFFKPRYKKIFDVAKSFGWKIMMHSCGKVDDVLEDLIEVGVDGINLQQPRVFDIAEVGRKFAGRICFYSLCDIQHTLPFKDDNYIREEAALLLKHWAHPKGGFVLDDYGDGAAIGVDDHKKQVMYDAFLANDPWSEKEQ